MKRDLLAKSLAQMGSKASAPTETPPKATEAAPRSLKSMSDVLSQVSAQSAQEVDVHEIADSEIADRFDVAEGLEDLIESIRTSGQQLPALLRYRRGVGPRYEVVYGRRRIAACRALGIKVKAYIKEMDQREALISQALENSARLERSFIEQALFSVKLEEQGFTRAEIGDVLAVDKGTLSKLIGVARDVPTAIIYKIGAAHDAGRRPWLELRRLVKIETALSQDAAQSLVPDVGTPAEKLNSLIESLQAAERAAKIMPDPSAKAPSPSLLTRLKDAPVAYRAKGKRLVIEISNTKDQGFIGYVEANLEQLYDEWVKKNP
ncbi:chromosome partitioning protein, ParB family [Celeribacter baekdonensis]|uniref:Chromosome partitioning protein, ParB family n=1 Tax=Celeribacter baekdonensis TaxID=875171 RepID=A0A1G7SLW8_9RHOB|nr:plasmid partitioning protein RepB [Celeribacter baekdonensis]SDG23978.1 chromosome partitioning protein, ParB family [Celeribacter baekdonensis]